MANPPILGQRPESNNPLLILANQMDRLVGPLTEIAANTRPDATAVIPHRYGVAEAEDKGGHGKVWGSFCMACSDSHGEFVYPCLLAPNEPIKPPPFFTIGDVFMIDDLGRMVRYQPPSTS